jgi:uncharacterized membrane protein
MVLIVALCVIVPMMHHAGAYLGLDGVAGKFDHLDLWRSTDPVTAFIYGLGDLFCHQDQARSFIVNGSQMPFCSRDVSIFVGMIAGLLSWEFISWRVDPTDRMVIVFSLVLISIMVLEWLSEGLFGYDSQGLRVITGMMAGAGIGTLIWAYSTHEFGVVEKR